jgi:phenylalanyl-tRNA synthetase beta chain
MLPKKQADIFHPASVEVMNPLTLELERMRPGILPNLLDIARRNERYGAPGQRLFEIGSVFQYSDTAQIVAQTSERMELALIVKDDLEEKNPYNAKEQKADIYSLRAVVEQVLLRYGIAVSVTPLSEVSPVGNWVNAKKIFESAETLAFTNGKMLLGLAGKLLASIQKEYDLRTEVFAAVIDYDVIHTLAKEKAMNPPAVLPLPRFPSVERDIALILAKNIAAAKLIEEVKVIAPKELCEDVRIFDEFESKEMKAASERSLGLRLMLRASDRTLEDGEVDELMRKIVETLVSKFSARLRS